jgi:hypothetical protein
MADKPAGTKSAQATMKFGDAVLQITDGNNVQPVSADIFTETRIYNGIVCLSFACIVTDGDSEPEAKITARLRLSLAGAADLRNALEGLLRQAMPGMDRAN